MIQQFSYVVDCPDGQVANEINTKIQAMTRYRSWLPEGHATWNLDDHRLLLTLRITGTDRWKCARYARQAATALLTRHGLVKVKPLIPTSVVTEPNLRGLTLEQGRTVRDYPDRATRAERWRARRQAQHGSAEVPSP